MEAQFWNKKKLISLLSGTDLGELSDELCE